MDANFGFWSLVPPLVAIIMAIKTRQVFISLLTGIFLGYLVIHQHLWNAFLATIDSLVNVFSSAGNTRTIMFCALVGALILLMQLSGGVNGLIAYMNEKLDKSSNDDPKKKNILIQFYAFVMGILIFVESSISVLTVGTVFRPIFDKMKISREKLAYIADSSSAPSCILIPFNGWGAYIMGLLVLEGFASPFKILMSSISFNFYPILTLFFVIYIIFSQKDWGPMKEAELRVKETGAVLSENAQPTVSDEISGVEPHKKAVFKPFNMLIPLLIMVLFMPVMLIYTGSKESELSFSLSFDYLIDAIGKGSGSTSVLVSVIISIGVACLLYGFQKILTPKEMIDSILKGVAGLIPLALLMMFAFAINTVCRDLQTGIYIAETTKEWLTPTLVPALLFAISCFIAFSTGTSWGTFSIMISIAIPMASTLQIDPALAIGAVLGGGVFGDHCSPISDTTIISSMAANTDHIDHVRTQLPYAMVTGITSFVLYIILGIVYV